MANKQLVPLLKLVHVVNQVKTKDADGYSALQLGFGDKKENTPQS